MARTCSKAQEFRVVDIKKLVLIVTVYLFTCDLLEQRSPSISSELSTTRPTGAPLELVVRTDDDDDTHNDPAKRRQPATTINSAPGGRWQKDKDNQDASGGGGGGVINESQEDCCSSILISPSKLLQQWTATSTTTTTTTNLEHKIAAAAAGERRKERRWSIITQAQAIRLIRLDAPNSIRSGQPLRLRCLYETRGDKLQSLSWYRNGREFYRYQPFERRQPILAFNLTGIQVDVSKSRNNTVQLTNTTTDTSGRFRCEATGTTFQEANLEVYIEVLPANSSSACVKFQPTIWISLIVSALVTLCFTFVNLSHSDRFDVA